jgi:hypothetical protein
MAHQARVKLTDVAVCLIQLSVTSPCVPAYYLHKHLCALHHARNHGPQPAWVGSQQSVVPLVPTTGYSGMTDLRTIQVLRDILEMRSDWRTSKPVR